jgi:hypothetical protein
VGFQCKLTDFWRNKPKGWSTIMVDDDSLVELLRLFLKDPRTSDAEIRSLSRLALLRYEDLRLQLIAMA